MELLCFALHGINAGSVSGGFNSRFARQRILEHNPRQIRFGAGQRLAVGSAGAGGGFRRLGGDLPQHPAQLGKSFLCKAHDIAGAIRVPEIGAGLGQRIAVIGAQRAVQRQFQRAGSEYPGGNQHAQDDLCPQQRIIFAGLRRSGWRGWCISMFGGILPHRQSPFFALRHILYICSGGGVGMQESGALHHKYRAKFCGQTSRKSSFRYRKTEHHNAVPALSVLRQHRTIPALRLKHRSGSCGTASALPKCSIRHPVLSALLAWHLPHLARRIST